MREVMTPGVPAAAMRYDAPQTLGMLTMSAEQVASMNTQMAAGMTARADKRLQTLYRAIGTLPKLDRLVYMLMLDGQDYTEIAEITGLSAGALRVRIHRAHQKLRNLLHAHV